jgi:hypothetical protein
MRAQAGSPSAASPSWKVQATPSPSAALYAQLSGVSCASAGNCIAVGSYNIYGGDSVPLAERWDGTVWALQNTHRPPGASADNSFSDLAGVSCVSAYNCTAVGSHGNL